LLQVSPEKFKIFLVYAQIFSTLDSSQIVIFPRTLKEYMSKFSIATIDIFNVLAFDCVVRLSFWIKFIAKMMMPLAMMLCLWIVYACVSSFHHRNVVKHRKRCLRCGEKLEGSAFQPTHKGPCPNPPTSADQKPQIARDAMSENLIVFRQRVYVRLQFELFKNKVFKLVFWVLLISYMPCSSAVLSFFRCKEVGDRHFLTADYDLECYTETWNKLLSLALAAVGAYLIGIPTFLMYVVYRARADGVTMMIKQIMKGDNTLRLKLLNETKAEYNLDHVLWVRPQSEQEEMDRLVTYLHRRNLRLQRNSSRIGFLYRYYTEQLWWFEGNELTRRLAVCVVLFFFEPGKPIQLVFTLCLLVGYAMFTTAMRPYRGDGNNPLAVWCQVQLCITIVCGLLIKLEVPISALDYDPETEAELITWIVIVSSLVIIVFGLFELWHEALNSRSRWVLDRQRRDRHTRMFRRAASRTQLLVESIDESKVIKREGSSRMILPPEAEPGMLLGRDKEDKTHKEIREEEEGYDQEKDFARDRWQTQFKENKIADDDLEPWVKERRVHADLKPLTQEQEAEIIRIFNDCDDNGTCVG
jgi:hypothetical protein